MNISRITAMIIKGNEVDCDSAGPDENGKFAGWISRMERGNYRPLLNTEPIYDSAEVAIKEMESIVKEINRLEL